MIGQGQGNTLNEVQISSDLDRSLGSAKYAALKRDIICDLSGLTLAT